MELKQYQKKALTSLDEYVSKLLAAQKANAKNSAPNDPAKIAWRAFWDARQQDTLYNSRSHTPDGTKPYPYLCLKLPTGGGKTLLGVEAIDKLFLQYQGRRTGLLLWVVPSHTIRNQTLKQFRDRAHPLRKRLEQLTQGRIKILTKETPFTHDDLRDKLCLMVLMLQSSYRNDPKKEDKEFLKMHRNSGNFTNFFPSITDYPANNEWLQKHPNLKTLNVSNRALGGIPNISVEHSLANVIRVARPVIIVDEGHRAYSVDARAAMDSLNPQCLLELTATPQANVSNVLTQVSGLELHAEEMIKLPIRVGSMPNQDWKATLKKALAKQRELQATADELYAKTESYIRPILLARVEFTGKKMEAKGLHVNEVKNYLMHYEGILEREIRIKTAEKDEIGDEDLLSRDCPVRVILTKDALKEGWDCPFAYILTLLAPLRTQTGLTQLTGRILRMPHTQHVETDYKSLNECYVYTMHKNVDDAMHQVRVALERDGMGDVRERVRTEDGTDGLPLFDKVARRNEFADQQLVLPQILFYETQRSQPRKLEYESHILPQIDWEKIRVSDAEAQYIAEQTAYAEGAVHLAPTTDLQWSMEPRAYERIRHSELDEIDIIRALSDIVPNAWHARDIVEDALEKAERAIQKPREEILSSGLRIAENLREILERRIHAQTEGIYETDLRKKRIRLSIKIPGVVFSMPHTIKIEQDTKYLRNEAGQLAGKTLYEKLDKLRFNRFEEEVALYTDRHDLVQWWHKFDARDPESYALQGWRKHKVYPDFIVRLTANGHLEYRVVESKGEHLSGNPDTEYKEKLFRLLEESFDVGEITGGNTRYRLLMQNGWKRNMDNILEPAA